eukprot:g25215.t1
MLQQTTVQAVKPYFGKFLARWPTVTDLAKAPSDDVMAAWAGLGYYARARNLKKCAEAVAAEHGGIFPDTEEGLRALPGIGDYTAAAVAAIAFNRPAAVMDGNIERVVSRVYGIDAPLPGAKPLIKARVRELTPDDRPGDFAQAMMDLGATICTPKRPACALCPLRDGCTALLSDDPERFPVKAAKKEKPVRLGAAYVAVTASGDILLRRRAESGLLGGMTEVPTTAWTARTDGGTTAGNMMADKIDHIVFDIGKVLIHYDPNIPYSRIIPDGEERKWFFLNVCTHEWNLEQDRGRRWEDAEALLIERYPDRAEQIRAFRRHWHEMVSHAYEDTVAIMLGLIDKGWDVTMLTNFAADTFTHARQLFPFLNRPRGVTVSGEIGLIKPDVEIYEKHARDFGLRPAATIFIDDALANVEGARAAGWKAVQFIDAQTLRSDLAEHGIRL